MSQHTEKLEGLLQAQAMDLAERHLEKGRQTSDQIIEDMQARLRQLEEGEELRFQLEAEHLCRQVMQSARLRVDAELDRLRWTLTEGVLAEVRERLKKLVDDRERYRSVLGRYLSEASQAIPEGNLVAELSPRDMEWIRPEWDALVKQSASGRHVSLTALSNPISGGMLVSSEAGSQRIDNTFEGRLARMENELLATIMDRLLPSGNNNKAAST